MKTSLNRGIGAIRGSPYMAAMINRRVPSVVTLALLFAGCGEAPRSADVRDQAAQRDARDGATSALTATRLDVAERRIAALERQMAETKASAISVDNDLLQQRLATTQAALAAASVDRDLAAVTPSIPAPRVAATPIKVSTPGAKPTPAPEPTPTPTPKPRPTPRLKLATPADFDPKQQ